MAKEVGESPPQKKKKKHYKVGQNWGKKIAPKTTKAKQ